VFQALLLGQPEEKLLAVIGVFEDTRELENLLFRDAAGDDEVIDLEGAQGLQEMRTSMRKSWALLDTPLTDGCSGGYTAMFLVVLSRNFMIPRHLSICFGSSDKFTLQHVFAS
jgi:hypothetical protein